MKHLFERVNKIPTGWMLHISTAIKNTDEKIFQDTFTHSINHNFIFLRIKSLCRY